MTVKVNFTRWDYFLFQLYLLPRSKSTWGVGLLSWLVTSWSVFNAYRDLEVTTDCDFCFVLAVAVLSLRFALPLFLILISLVMALSILAATPESGRVGKQEISLREDGLFEITAANEILTRWGGIKSIKRTKRFILVGSGGGGYHVITRKSFPDQAAYDEFAALLYRRWEKNRTTNK